MTPAELRALIQGGETLAVEFKGEERAPLNDRDLVEAVVCLANRKGSEPGWLLVGVEDDGRITGAPSRHGGSTDPDRLAVLLAARTRPSVLVHVYALSVDGLPVLAIKVTPQRMPVGTSEGVFVGRALGGDGRPAGLPMNAVAIQRAGIVERTARGIDTIFYEQLHNGRPAPSSARSNEITVSIVIPGGAANLDFVRLLVTEAQSGRVLGLDELLILNSLWQEHSLATEEATHLTQKPEPEARATVHRLAEAGLIEERGQKKGPHVAFLRRGLPAPRRKGRLRPPTWLRAAATGSDGPAIRRKARAHYAP